MPAYDVVIPTFNRAHLVGDAVMSAARQHPAPAHIVVVDDASTDGSGAVLDALQASLSILTVIKLPQNRGVAAARNAGIAVTQSPWIGFLDSDDLWLPDAAKSLLTACGHGAIDIATRFFMRRTADGITSPAECGWSGQDIVEALAKGGAVGTSWTMVSQALIKTIDGFDPSFSDCEDWDFFVRAAAAGGRFTRCNDVIAIYRTPEGDRIMDNPDPTGVNTARIRAHPLFTGHFKTCVNNGCRSTTDANCQGMLTANRSAVIAPSRLRIQASPPN